MNSVRSNDSIIGILTAGLACDVCGRRPHPARLRLTLAKLGAVFPVELVLHALIVHYHLAYALSVAILTVTATVLVIWVVEPSAMRLLGSWLHAPAARARAAAETAPGLWRIRVTVKERPGSLEQLTHELAALEGNILGLHVHPLEDGSCMNEIIVTAPGDVDGDDLATAMSNGGGGDPSVWPTSALALVDGQTTALGLAARVAADPAELPLAVAELLRARVVTDRLVAADAPREAPPDGSSLRIPSPWSGAFTFTRPGEPFTPAESARAHRLAEVAEAAVLACRHVGARDDVSCGRAS